MPERGRTCAGHAPCRRPLGWRHCDTDPRTRHSHQHASSRCILPSGPSGVRLCGRRRSDIEPWSAIGPRPMARLAGGMALPRSPLGLNQWRLQWLTVRRDRKPKAGRSGSCRCPLSATACNRLPGNGTPTLRPGCRRQRSPDPPAHAAALSAMQASPAGQRMASASGASRAVDLPTQSASVERSMSSPSRSKIWLWR